jgi:uncharacterized membrane protein YqjE
MTPGDGAGPGPFRRLSASLVALGRIRLELLAIEVQEEKERIARMLVWAVVASFMGCFAVVFVALFVTLALWDGYRLVALGAFALVFIGLAAWAGVRLSQLSRAGTTLFQASIVELRQDSRALDPTRAP